MTFHITVNTVISCTSPAMFHVWKWFIMEFPLSIVYILIATPTKQTVLVTSVYGDAFVIIFIVTLFNFGLLEENNCLICTLLKHRYHRNLFFEFITFASVKHCFHNAIYSKVYLLMYKMFIKSETFSLQLKKFRFYGLKLVNRIL